MNKLKILIGPAGSGKSTYSNKIKNENTIMLSSDEIRKELFNDLNHQDKASHVKVFDLMNKRLKQILKKEDNKIIIYDATNLSRKRRANLYNMTKSININNKVEAVIFFTSLNELIFRNATREHEKQVPEKIILNMYKSTQTPQISFDCDNIKCIGEKWFVENANLKNVKTVKDVTLLISPQYGNIENELFLNYTNHDTPYHIESVDEHIAWTIENANTEFLKTVAIFHDLGKGLNKIYDNEKQKATYRGHEMLGAYYLLNYLYSTNQLTNENLEMVYTVAYHMLRREKMRKNKLNQMMTSQNLIDQLNAFNKIDNKSRKVNFEGI